MLWSGPERTVIETCGVRVLTQKQAEGLNL
jgi:hypothetical protein